MAASLASDLGVLQDRANLQWPLVMVASSIGGVTAEMFARTYPERVEGLVFADASNGLVAARLAPRSGTIAAAACTAAALAQLDVIRLLDPFALGTDTDGARRSAAVTYGAKPWWAICATARGLAETARQFEHAPPLRADIPLVALSASSTKEMVPPFAARLVDAEQIRAELEESHRQFAKTSSRGQWRKAPDSTHLIASSPPDAVANAVLDVLEMLQPDLTSNSR